MLTSANFDGEGFLSYVDIPVQRSATALVHGLKWERIPHLTILTGPNGSGKTTTLERLDTLIGSHKRVRSYSANIKYDDKRATLSSAFVNLQRKVRPPKVKEYIDKINDFLGEFEEDVKIRLMDDLQFRHIDDTEAFYRHSDLSSGELSLMEVVTSLFSDFDWAESPNECKRVALMDEMERFMHPPFIRILLIVVNKMLKKGVQVIMVSHNPVTITLAERLHKEEGLFRSLGFWRIDNVENVKTITKFASAPVAVSFLSKGLLRITHDIRYVILEGKTDPAFYNMLYKKLKGEFTPVARTELRFLTSSVNPQAGGNCDLVYTKVSSLQGEYLGAVDNDDGKNKPTEDVYVLTQYSVENYLCAPINLLLSWERLMWKLYFQEIGKFIGNFLKDTSEKFKTTKELIYAEYSEEAASGSISEKKPEYPIEFNIVLLNEFYNKAREYIVQSYRDTSVEQINMFKRLWESYKDVLTHQRVEVLQELSDKFCKFLVEKGFPLTLGDNMHVELVDGTQLIIPSAYKTHQGHALVKWLAHIVFGGALRESIDIRRFKDGLAALLEGSNIGSINIEFKQGYTPSSLILHGLQSHVSFSTKRIGSREKVQHEDTIIEVLIETFGTVLPVELVPRELLYMLDDMKQAVPARAQPLLEEAQDTEINSAAGAAAAEADVGVVEAQSSGIAQHHNVISFCSIQYDNPFYNYPDIAEVFQKAKKIGGRDLLKFIADISSDKEVGTHLVREFNNNGIDNTIHILNYYSTKKTLISHNINEDNEGLLSFVEPLTTAPRLYLDTIIGRINLFIDAVNARIESISSLLNNAQALINEVLDRYTEGDKQTILTTVLLDLVEAVNTQASPVFVGFPRIPNDWPGGSGGGYGGSGDGKYPEDDDNGYGFGGAAAGAAHETKVANESVINETLIGLSGGEVE